LRFDETKKEKGEGESHQEMEIAEVIVELIYIIFMVFRGRARLKAAIRRFVVCEKE